MAIIKKFRSINDPAEFIYWSRICMAIAASFFCAIFRLGVIGLGVGLTFYILSYVLFVYFFKNGSKKIEKKSKLYTIGLGSYFSIWITIWALLHTFFVGI